MNSEAEILNILQAAYDKKEDTDSFRKRITEHMYNSEFYYMFIDEAFDAIENNVEPVEQLIGRWALTFCLHGEILDKDSIYTMQIVLWRELFYSVLSEIEVEDEDEDYEDEDE